MSLFFAPLWGTTVLQTFLVPTVAGVKSYYIALKQVWFSPIEEADLCSLSVAQNFRPFSLISMRCDLCPCHFQNEKWNKLLMGKKRRLFIVTTDSTATDPPGVMSRVSSRQRSQSSNKIDFCCVIQCIRVCLPTCATVGMHFFWIEWNVNEIITYMLLEPLSVFRTSNQTYIVELCKSTSWGPRETTVFCSNR